MTDDDEPKYYPISSLCNDYDECSLCPEDQKGCDLNELRENEPNWIDDPKKKKPLRIDINGIRLGNLIVVKREALEEAYSVIEKYYHHLNSLGQTSSRLAGKFTVVKVMKKLNTYLQKENQ